MILGVISDTHLDGVTMAFLELLAVPLGKAEVLIHAGDHTGTRIVDHLELVDPRPYYGVAGNMDLGEVAKRLPREQTITLEGFTIGIVHGWGAPEGMRARVAARFDPLPDIVIFGHSHKPLIERVGKTLFVNPGSPFDKRWAPTRTAALVELCPGGPHARLVDLGR
ncbi:metallophosphoesterase [bacterium]|nr:MAG: metallophosphoesterase [bacterium]